MTCLGAFFVSRLLAWVLGVRFDASGATGLWQTIDFELLRNKALESLWFAHTQPPMFNAVIAAVLKWSPLSFTTTFAIGFFALGLVLTVALVSLTSSLRIRRWLAIVTVCLVMTSPTVILYENFLFYDYPIAVALTVMAAVLARDPIRLNVPLAMVVVGLATIITLTRSLFHPVWLILVIILVVAVVDRGRRRTVLLWSGLAMCVVVLFITKNAVLYGQANLSSWFGMNLAHTTIHQVPWEQRRAWVEDGRADVTILLPEFGGYDTYAPYVPGCQPKHDDVAVLAEPAKSTGETNFNDECFLPLYQRYLDSSLTVLRNDPQAYLRSIVNSFEIFLQPAHRYGALTPNLNHLDWWDTIHSRVALATVDVPTAFVPPEQEQIPSTQWTVSPGPLDLSLTVLAGVSVCLVAPVLAARRWRRSGRTPVVVYLAFVGLTTWWVMLVGNLLETGENNRFRLVIDPLVLLTLGLTADRILSRLQRRRARDQSPSR